MDERYSHIDDMIADYLTGNLSSEDGMCLKQWVEQSDENRRYFFNQVSVWTSMPALDDALYDKERAFRLFQNRVKGTTARGRHIWMNITKYAAMLLLLAGVSYYCYTKGESDVKTNFSEIVVEAPRGSNTHLYLPDGTQVWLNAGSRIAYSQGFGVDDREVHLWGEGYFEVTPNKNLPLHVRTKNLHVQVLGTKFNFRDYESDLEAVVTLLQGKVLLNNLLRKEKDVVLTPDNRAVLNKKNGLMKVENSVAVNARDWTNGYLFFNEETLSDILGRLERSYDVEFVVSHDSLLNIRFYGSFMKQEYNIHDVIDALSSTGKFHYKIDGKKIMLYK